MVHWLFGIGFLLLALVLVADLEEHDAASG
jgi:hypothetical protein